MVSLCLGGENLRVFDGLCGEAPPKRGTFFDLLGFRVTEKVWISWVEEFVINVF